MPIQRKRKIHIVLSDETLALTERYISEKKTKKNGSDCTHFHLENYFNQMTLPHQESFEYFQVDDFPNEIQSNHHSYWEFFSQTHEEQESPFIAFIQEKQRRLLQKEIDGLMTARDIERQMVKATTSHFVEKERKKIQHRVKEHQQKQQQHQQQIQQHLLMESSSLLSLSSAKQEWGQYVKDQKRKLQEMYHRLKLQLGIRQEFILKQKINKSLQRIMTQCQPYSHPSLLSSSNILLQLQQMILDTKNDEPQKTFHPSGTSRFKHRRETLTSKMDSLLFIDLFDQGILVHTKDKQDEYFVPWSCLQSRLLVFSILCGQVPPLTRFHIPLFQGPDKIKESMIMKCTVSDYRSDTMTTTITSTTTTNTTELDSRILATTTTSRYAPYYHLPNRIQSMMELRRKDHGPTRKHSFLLRPRFSTLVDQLKEECPTYTQAVRLEQLLLLAMYPKYMLNRLQNPCPPSSDSLISSLSQFDAWSEPGSHLILDPNPRLDTNTPSPTSILTPLVFDGSLSQIYLSQVLSSSGRQLSSYLTPHHIRYFIEPIGDGFGTLSTKG